MGLVQVDEREEPAAAHGLDPARRRGDGVAAGPLRHHEGRPRLRPAEAVVVDVEAAREAEARVEDEGADEGPRAPAGAAQDRRQRRRRLREAEAAVVAHAVRGRQPTREDVGVGRQRHDVVGARGLEPHAARGEAVDPRRARVLATVAAEGVGAQRVDRDEQHGEAGVALHGAGSVRQARAASAMAAIDAAATGDPATALVVRRRARGGRDSPTAKPASTHRSSGGFDSDTRSVGILKRERGHP